MGKVLPMSQTSALPYLRQKAWAWREWAANLVAEPVPEPGKVDFALWQTGLGVVVPSLWEAQRDAISLLRGHEVPPQERTLAVLLTISPDSEGLVLTRTGLSGLTRAFLDSLALQVHQEMAQPARYRWVGYKQEHEGFRPVPEMGLLRRIRRRLALAPQADYDQVLDWATAHMAHSSLDQRCVLAALLPDQGWAPKVARDCLQAPQHRWGYRILPEFCWALLPSLRDADLVHELCEAQSYGAPPADMATSLLANLGSRAYPTVLRYLQGADREQWAEPLWEVEDAELAGQLKVLLEDRLLRPKLATYYEKFPQLGLPVLAQAALAPGKSKETARVMLTQILRRVQQLPPLEARERAYCDQLLARFAHAALEAEPAELPGVLREPPWLTRRQPQSKEVAQSRPVDFEEKIHWQEPLPRDYYYSVPPPPGMSDEAAYQRIRKHLDAKENLTLSELDRLSDSRALRIWLELEPRRCHDPWDGLLPLLRRFALDGLPGFLRFAERNSQLVVQELQIVESPRLALLMAGALHSPRGRKLAAHWLLAYPRAALLGLIPAAVGTPGPPRSVAEEGVRWLALKLGSEPVLEVGQELDVAAALQSVLDFDPLLTLPARMPRLPFFLDASALPRPLLKSGKALPLSALEHLLTMLSFTPLDPPYAGLVQVREACQPDSLEEFAWELYLLWNASGYPAKEKWMFQSLACFGGDEVARRLGPLMRQWPQQSLFARAEQGLDLLGLIGTDVALMHVYQLSQKVKSKALQEKARLKLDEIASRRGLTAEELADRMVSDLDLEEDGSCTLDLGQRLLKVRFDQHLKPQLVDGEGKLLKEFPKVSGELAETAAARWKALQKDAKVLGKSQVLRLELAMSQRRRWTQSAWQLFLLGHPLLVHLVRRLLWGVYLEDRLLEGFRVAEDSSLANLQDAPFELPAGAFLGIPYPLELEEQALQAWSQIFADYQILQPFPQLGRPIYRLKEAEKASLTLERQQKRKVHPGKLLNLEERGWVRGETLDGGCCTSLRRPLGSEFTAELEFHDGIFLGALQQSGDQVLGPLRLERQGQTACWGELDPVATSEILADLEGLR